jgi:hypothetical protein
LLCILECLMSSSFRPKHLLHTLHLNGFSPL